MLKKKGSKKHPLRGKVVENPEPNPYGQTFYSEIRSWVKKTK